MCSSDLQGDLAIIVKSKMGNEGKIVRCLEYIGPVNGVMDVNGVLRHRREVNAPVWRIDREIAFGSPEHGTRTTVMYCADNNLRPLRGDLDDESITEEKELSTVV